MVRQQCSICGKWLYNAGAQAMISHQSYNRKCLKWRTKNEADGRSLEREHANRMPAMQDEGRSTSCFSPDSVQRDNLADEWHEVQDADAMGEISPASSCYSADSVQLERSPPISRSPDILRDGNLSGGPDAEYERQEKLDQTAARQLAGQTNKQHQRWRSQSIVATCGPRTHASTPPPPPSPPDTVLRFSRHPRSWGASHKRSSSRKRRRSRSRRDSRSRRRSRSPRGSADARRQRCSRMPETDDHDRSYVSPQYLSPLEYLIASVAAAREMATRSGTLSSCPCACRLPDAVQGEHRCEHCKCVTDRGEMRHCGPPEIGLIGLAQARSSSAAMKSRWGSWWGEDGNRLSNWGKLRSLRCETVRISPARIPLTVCDVHRSDVLVAQLEPKQDPIRESTFGRAIRAMRASRRCELRGSVLDSLCSPQGT
jgi:hypothetical protein